jgi:hypothetical protein
MISSLKKRTSSSQLIALLMLVAASFSLHAQDIDPVKTTHNEPVCADFLSFHRIKPPNLEFIECKKINSKGLTALESQYRVEGIHAGEIERYFIKTARMPRLRYLCCGWESFPDKPKSQTSYGLYKSGKQQYQISMGSGETLVNSRSNWLAIPYFHVTAILYLDLP